jgi:hypothetical protein
MAQRINAELLSEHLRKRTTAQLCADYVHMAKGEADWHKFTTQMISDILLERNEVAWWEWQTESHLFGVPDPLRFFMPK